LIRRVPLVARGANRISTRDVYYALIEYSDGVPTAALQELCDNLALRAEMELVKLDRCLTGDVPAFNTRCREAGVDAIVPK
jgi:hypothetical protein